jgi:hypothetical protein
MPNKEPAIKRIRIFSEVTANGIKNMLMRITNFIVIKTLCLIKYLLMSGITQNLIRLLHIISSEIFTFKIKLFYVKIKYTA